jgi:hypothetical protein
MKLQEIQLLILKMRQSSEFSHGSNMALSVHISLDVHFHSDKTIELLEAGTACSSSAHSLWHEKK